MVVTFNSEGRVSRFLAPMLHVLAAIDADVEVTIVDNASTDGTLAAIARHGIQAKVRPLPANVGFAAACNVGVAATTAEWVLFLNDDLRMGASDANNLWSARSQNSCLVPVVRGVDGRLQNMSTMHWSRLDLKVRLSDTVRPFTAYPLGCCFLIGRELLSRVGGLDERFMPAYYEDAALGVALWSIGAPVRVAVDAEAIHYSQGGDPSPEKIDAVNRLVLINRWVFAGLALRGWRRLVCLTCGGARTAMQSVRMRSWAPLTGYCEGMRRLIVGRARDVPLHRKLDQRQILRSLAHPSAPRADASGAVGHGESNG